MWHKAVLIGHLMEIELTREDLLVEMPRLWSNMAQGRINRSLNGNRTNS